MPPVKTADKTAVRFLTEHTGPALRMVMLGEGDARERIVRAYEEHLDRVSRADVPPLILNAYRHFRKGVELHWIYLLSGELDEGQRRGQPEEEIVRRLLVLHEAAVVLELRESDAAEPSGEF
jgi:predicted LPLAT superfamily acyltransferase